MSLLLLFLSVKQSISASPSVLYAIEITKPTLLFVQDVVGNFTTSTITYSSATNTYNDGLYGGSEATKPVMISLTSIDAATPTVYSIDRL